MKEVLGIFAAIAAVAGIASVVSKEDEKEEAKQRQREQELELEERRLTVEAAQRKHIQQMEQQRLQMEQEKRDYQMKLANAPKKPVYKTVASLQCPLCMGHREVNEAAGEVHCPYCGATEQLEVDHYEIDQAAFQKQLQEAEQQRAAQEALEQRNERLNTAIKIVACVMGVALLILLISPIVGIAFFVPPFLLFCFLLYKRFPEKGGKVWNVIKFPLTCIFVFPLPLTALFMGSEKMEERFSKKARIGMSIGTWAVYAALICFLGIAYVNGFKNAFHSDHITQYEVAESQPAVQATQERAEENEAAENSTTKANAKTTETSTNNKIPSENKKRLNYYDSDTNVALSFDGIQFEIPEMWTEHEADNSENLLCYYDKGEHVEIGKLLFVCLDTSGKTINERDIAEQIISSSLDENTQSSYVRNVTIDGQKGVCVSTVGNLPSNNKNKIEVDYHVTIFSNETSQKYIGICLMEYHDADSTYWNDYNEIIKNAKIMKEDTDEAQTTEPEMSTEESAQTSAEVNEKPQVIRINMDDLEKERDENAAAAKAKYKGQCIEVVGRVGSIDSDLDFISILSPTDSWDIVGVHCSLVNDAIKEKVKTLKVDQTIIVRGTITDVGDILGYFMDAEDIIIE